MKTRLSYLRRQQNYSSCVTTSRYTRFSTVSNMFMIYRIKIIFHRGQTSGKYGDKIDLNNRRHHRRDLGEICRDFPRFSEIVLVNLTRFHSSVAASIIDAIVINIIKHGRRHYRLIAHRTSFTVEPGPGAG